jgi:transposase InsO family protein
VLQAFARPITDAFPWNEAPDYLIRDGDGSYWHVVTRRRAAMGIRDHPTATRSPWQNGHAERLIGSIRRECLDHIVVFGDAHLRQILAAYTCLLQRAPNAPDPGQGFAGSSAGSAVRPVHCAADPWRPSSSILPDVVIGRDRAFSYEPGDDDDEPIFRFDKHVFVIGEYVTVT